MKTSLKQPHNLAFPVDFTPELYDHACRLAQALRRHVDEHGHHKGDAELLAGARSLLDRIKDCG